MAARLGYGGVANTNGARDFSGKTPATGGDELIAMARAVARVVFSRVFGRVN